MHNPPKLQVQKRNLDQRTCTSYRYFSFQHASLGARYRKWIRLLRLGLDYLLVLSRRSVLSCCCMYLLECQLPILITPIVLHAPGVLGCSRVPTSSDISIGSHSTRYERFRILSRETGFAPYCRWCQRTRPFLHLAMRWQHCQGGFANNDIQCSSTGSTFSSLFKKTSFLWLIVGFNAWLSDCQCRCSRLQSYRWSGRVLRRKRPAEEDLRVLPDCVSHASDERWISHAITRSNDAAKHVGYQNTPGDLERSGSHC